MTIPGDVHGKEFGGIKGAAAISLLVVYFSYFFAIGCSEHGCPPLPVDRFFSRGFTKYAKLQGWLDLWDTQATLVYAGWYSYCVLCWAVLPGKWVQGTQLRDGKRLSYKMNGGQDSNVKQFGSNSKQALQLFQPFYLLSFFLSYS